MEQAIEKLTEDQIKGINPKNAININIGVLGHVDSGKTSLSRALTQVTSTAGLDKHPQSQEKGITIDLGFTAFYSKIPENQKNLYKDKEFFQFTLVDCPGHASLIKTILAGASIIDIMFLVIDVNKGIQTQTAECLVIGEILMQKMIVVLNKIDMIEGEKKEEILQKKIENLRKVFAKTKFGADLPIIPISAMVGANSQNIQSTGIENLIKTLLSNIEQPIRNSQGPFLFLIDHSFPIKGQGTVCTGTVIQGQAKVGNEMLFPQYDISKPIKSIQMFKKPIDSVQQGDRCGLMFAQLQVKPERGIISQAKILKSVQYAIVPVNKVQYFKAQIRSKMKMHFTSNHQTILGQIVLFSHILQNGEKELVHIQKKNANFQQQQNLLKFNFDEQFEYMEDYDSFAKVKANIDNNILYAFITFDQPVLATQGTLMIGAKFDQDITANQCRLAFYGNIIQILEENQIKQLKIFREKKKVQRQNFQLKIKFRGIIEKIVDNYTVLIKDLFKKESNINVHLNKTIIMSLTGNEGKLTASFGKSGKVKAQFQQGVIFIPGKDQIQGNKSLDEEEKKQDQSEEDILQLQENLINSEVQMVYRKILFNKKLKQ